MSVLAEILRHTRADVARRHADTPMHTLVPLRGRRAHAFRDALVAPGMSVIAEHKRRSPSAGPIRPGSSVAEVASAYERGGAVAMSVLTDERYFDGSLDDLRQAASACSLPLLRKDFVVDPYQLHEAAAAGASAVLLIVAALEPSALAELGAAAHELALDVLVEVHDRDELEIAVASGAAIIGVNNRDLRDFSVDLERTFTLLEWIPPGVIVVSESGIARPEQLQRLQAAGVAAVLVGERLMRAPDPVDALRALRGAV